MIQDIAPHQFHNQWKADCQPKEDSPIFVFKEDKLLIHIEEGKKQMFRLPKKAEIKAEVSYTFLFSLDDQDYYLAEALDQGIEHHERSVTEEQIYQESHDGFDEDGRILVDGFAYRRLHEIRAEKIGEKYEYFISVTAYQLSKWYGSNRFCGKCGSRTGRGSKERVIICPTCGNHIYPKIVPAVIVGITNGDKLLMTKYANRGIGYYALVAGFTEIGETFEETVAREAMEETGLKVKNIRYYKSQPWGVVDDLLAGFYCDVDGDDTIRMDEEELAVAEWVDRKDIVGQPDHLSLTNEMMLVFREGREPKA